MASSTFRPSQTPATAPHMSNPKAQCELCMPEGRQACPVLAAPVAQQAQAAPLQVNPTRITVSLSEYRGSS